MDTNMQSQTRPEKIASDKDDFLQKMNTALDKWQNDIAQLEGEVDELKAEAEAEYREQISALRKQWRRLQDELHALEIDDTQKWQESAPALQRKADEFKEAFKSLADRLQEKEEAVLGWLQGYSDERTTSSEGWMEGYGERPEGSEGWVEGLGKRPEGSKGWREGYDKTN